VRGAFECGRALLEKRTHAFALIFRPERVTECGLLQPVGIGQRHVHAVSNQSLCRGHRQRTLACDLGCGLARRGEQLVGLEHRIRQPESKRFVRVDHLPGVDQLAGSRRPNAPREPLRPAETRNDAEVDLGLTEFGFARRVDEVARQRELAATAQGEAVDRSDHRAPKFLDRGEHLVSERTELEPLGLGHVFHGSDVGTSDEGLSGPGDHRRPDLIILGKSFDRSPQIREHFLAERV
jgi:hypothetical protein